MRFHISTVSAAIAPCARAPFSLQVQPLRASPRSRSRSRAASAARSSTPNSMQVYRDLRTITARPTSRRANRRAASSLWPRRRRDELFRRPLARRFRDRAARAEARELTPIVVGGTGMYFKAALSGFRTFRRRPARCATPCALGAGQDPAQLHAELAARDPETAATLRDTDPQRLLRALEVLEATGRPLVSFHGRAARRS